MAVTRLALLLSLVLVFIPQAQGTFVFHRRYRNIAAVRREVERLHRMHNQLQATINGLGGKIHTMNNNWSSYMRAVEGRLLANDRSLQQSVNALNANFQAMNTRIGGLRTNNQLKATVNALEGKLQIINNNLKSAISAVEGRLQARDNNLQSAINALQGDVQAMKTKMGVIDQRADFLATFASTTPAISSGTIVFDHVLANNGGGYNGHTGVFTAPVRGFYVFTANVYVREHGRAFWDLMVNGQLRMRKKHVASEDSSNQFLYPVQLQAGDRVYVSNLSYIHLWGNLHSFFGGWLIKAF